jgi:hypothetical protein
MIEYGTLEEELEYQRLQRVDKEAKEAWEEYNSFYLSFYPSMVDPYVPVEGLKEKPAAGEGLKETTAVLGYGVPTSGFIDTEF